MNPMNPWVEFLVKEVLFPLAAASVPTLAGFIILYVNKLRQKVGLENVAIDKSNMEQELTTSLNFAISDLTPAIEKYGWKSKEVQDLILNKATSYMRSKFADRSALIGGGGKVVKNQDQLTQEAHVKNALKARLPAAAAVAELSPATPDANPVNDNGEPVPVADFDELDATG